MDLIVRIQFEIKFDPYIDRSPNSLGITLRGPHPLVGWNDGPTDRSTIWINLLGGQAYTCLS